MRMNFGVFAPWRAGLAAGALALALSACASAPGSDPADTIGNVFAFNSTRAPQQPAQAAPSTSTTEVICPIVDIKEGGAAHRVYSGRGTSNNDVRYQFSIGQTARECSVQNGQIAMRVGVEGKVLLGPAGGSSSFNVPVSIAVRDEASQQMLSEKTYQVAVTIPSGQPHATFSVVSETIFVPLKRREANEDYLIIVGFETAKAGPNRRRVSRRR